jgi:glucokinase
MYYLGLDIGGMSIKCGVVNEKGQLGYVCRAVTPIGDFPTAIRVIDELCRETARKAGIPWQDIQGIGAGAPGTVCGDIVTYATNLGWYNVPFVEELSQATGKRVAVGNDANCALLAEWRFGSAKGYDNVAMITLGTGVGTAFICDGRLLLGNGAACGEGGHMRIKNLGRKCNCGREDCWEIYASASSLQERTSALVEREPMGLLARLSGGQKVDGLTFFRALAEGDESCRQVLLEFQEDVVDGLVNIANLFRPKLIVMGGGICAQPTLLAPLEFMVNARTLGGKNNPHVEVAAATFDNDAGIIGGACLVIE